MTTAPTKAESTLAEADCKNIGNGMSRTMYAKTYESEELKNPKTSAVANNLQAIGHQRPTTKDLLARIALSPFASSKITA